MDRLKKPPINIIAMVELYIFKYRTFFPSKHILWLVFFVVVVVGVNKTPSDEKRNHDIS